MNEHERIVAEVIRFLRANDLPTIGNISATIKRLVFQILEIVEPIVSRHTTHYEIMKT